MGLLSSVNRGFPQFYVPDPQGNTRDLVYQYSGAPADDHYIFMAFGNELGPVGPSNNPYRYNGQWGYYRDILDRMYVQARHYDAIKGRWLSEDPIGLGAWDANLYRYASNDPMRMIDPTGLYCWPHFWKCLGLGGLLAAAHGCWSGLGAWCQGIIVSGITACLAGNIADGEAAGLPCILAVLAAAANFGCCTNCLKGAAMAIVKAAFACIAAGNIPCNAPPPPKRH